MNRLSIHRWMCLPPMVALLVALASPTATAQEVPDTPVISLDEAHRLARQNSYRLKNLEEALEQARNLQWRAFAILLPNLSAEGNITLNDKEISFEMPDPNTGATESVVFQERWTRHFGATANITLFNAQSIPLIQSADDNIEATRQMNQHQQNELLFAVSAAFYGLRSATEAVAIAREDHVNAREFQRMALARKRVGQALQIEVHRADILVMEAEKQLENTRDGVTLARTGLGYLIGVQGDFLIEEPSRPDDVNLALDDLQAMALETRPDLKAARYLVEINQRERSRTWMQWLPSFDATFNFNWDSVAGFAGENHSWRLIFGARWDLLSGGQRIADMYQADSRIRQAENDLLQMERDAMEDVERKFIEIRKRRRNVEMAGKQLTLAEENHRLSEKMYGQGLATRLELLDATTTLSRARRNLAIESLSRDLAVLELKKAVGQDL